MTELPSGAAIRLYHGTAEYRASVGWFASEPDGSSQLQGVGGLPVRRQFAQIHLHEPYFGEPGDRIIIRVTDDSIIGGTVLSKTRPRWLNRASTVEFLVKLACADFKEATAYLVDCSRHKMVQKNLLLEFLPYGEREYVLQELITKGKITEIADNIFSSGSLAQLEDQVMARLDLILTDRRDSGGKIPFPWKNCVLQGLDV